jgi:hypothetical protein
MGSFEDVVTGVSRVFEVRAKAPSTESGNRAVFAA